MIINLLALQLLCAVPPPTVEAPVIMAQYITWPPGGRPRPPRPRPQPSPLPPPPPPPPPPPKPYGYYGW